MTMGLIRFLFLMPGDVISRARKGRHRRQWWTALTALFNRRSMEWDGVTAESPLIADLPLRDPEPEETPEEAVLREAAETVDHWATEYAHYEAEVRTWFDELVADDPIAAVLLAEERERLARKASVEAAHEADVPTGEWPLVRAGVA
jgi:hypothetical protein